jgi:hypothetical protein
MLVVLLIIGLILIIYGLILSYWDLKKNHAFVVDANYKVYLIHLNTLYFFEVETFKETSLFRFTLKSYFHYLMYQFENETDSRDLLKIFKKQQEKDKAKIKIFNK